MTTNNNNNNATESVERQVIRVSYTIEDIILVPKGVRLTSNGQNWGIKWNKLYITGEDGVERDYDAEGWIDHFDYKRPSLDPEILDAEEYLDEEQMAEIDSNREESNRLEGRGILGSRLIEVLGEAIEKLKEEGKK
nr:MAG: hypothetical protein [Lake Baikal virophage 8]